MSFSLRCFSFQLHSKSEHIGLVGIRDFPSGLHSPSCALPPFLPAISSGRDGRKRPPAVAVLACRYSDNASFAVVHRKPGFFGTARTARSSGIIDKVELIYFCARFIIGGALLLKRRIQARDLVVRQQLKWISYGTLAGVVPFILIYVIPVVLGARATFAMDSSILSCLAFRWDMH
jgi:hypothetical protein